MRGLVVTIGAVVAASLACSGLPDAVGVGDGVAAGDDATEPAPPQVATVHLLAATGGRVALPDGTRLDVPPGALPADTDVTLRRESGGPSSLGVVVLEPHDLTLSSPAALHVPFDPSRVAPDHRVGARVSTGALPPRHAGSELSAYRPVEVRVEHASAVLTVPHFSIWHLFSYPWMLVALDIPPKHLRDGDLLYTLTSSSEFMDAESFPIHVAVFSENGDAGAVVESTVPDAGCTDGYDYGVGLHPFEPMRTLCGKHVYLGARRPVGASPEDGVAAARAARSRIGQLYGVLGVIPPGGVSCVELTEDAWEDAGVNVTWINDEVLTPWDQYLRTEPVRRIVTTPRERSVQVGVIAAVRNDTDRYDAAGANPPFRKEVRLELIPRDDASRDRVLVAHHPRNHPWRTSPTFATLTFRPTPDDVDRGVYAYDARFTERASGQSLVVPDFVEFQVVPAPRCPWRTTLGYYDFAGEWVGTGNGTPFRRTAKLQVDRYGSQPDDWVFGVFTDDGNGGAARHGDFAVTLAHAPGDLVDAGAHTRFPITSNVPSVQPPGPPTLLAYMGCSVPGPLQNLVGVGSGSTLTLDVSDDCRTARAHVRIETPAEPQHGEWGPGCSYEAHFVGTATFTPPAAVPP